MNTPTWQPITPLEVQTAHDFTTDDALQRRWQAHRVNIEAEGMLAVERFQQQLHRSWAIETGIIEGLYTLDRSMTETLIEHGISAQAISRQSTNREPEELAQILADHQAALSAIYREVRNGHSISRSAIRQLHQTVVAHQPTYRAMNQFGQRFNARLNAGAFKTRPNNPTRPDGVVHLYCPPEHVDSELSNMLDWYNEYIAEPNVYHPLLVAAWLHHRFTQIHPFQDGNGRVARALVAWHLVQHDYLPSVVTRDDRNAYIEALEAADDGDLGPLVDFTTKLHRRTILQAISTPEPEPDQQSLDAVIDELARRMTERRGQPTQETPPAVKTLCDAVESRLQQQVEAIVEKTAQASLAVRCRSWQQQVAGNRHPFREQVTKTAQNHRHWFNHIQESRFAALEITQREGAGAQEFAFVVSFHHVGRRPSGITTVTAFAVTDDEFLDCTPEPIVVTAETKADTTTPFLLAWTDTALADALDWWGQRIT